ncbi:O-Antigen ligase [Lutibacter oricola]|uniref:O-Antigen ligase n=1 Tax=Lutibacter oricola TaxID=762486 RepID=A0A1H2X2Q5_9FLAO|nr:O-antigen ligase family protein [Lutibacter oricola]SDW86774.1 O-Antigen ligase [Lutibacter oricola]
MTNKRRFILSVLHLGLGVVLLSGVVSKIFSLLILFFGIYFIIKNRNENNEAAFFSAYIVGGEVLFRMSGGLFLYELPKYSILFFLIIGLYIEDKRHHISVSYLVYILLLLVGISFTNIPFNESIRKAIAFNLSGPILLGVSAIYFYKRVFKLDEILNLLFFMALPIFSMLSLLFFKTPELAKIGFGSSANFAASGGYGPNQVSTILGLGIFIITVHLYFKQRIFIIFLLDVVVFMYLIFRGLITFSRGGMLTAFICIALFLFFYVLATREKLKSIMKYGGLILFFGISLGVYTSNVTGGMLENRYMNKNAAGIAKKDITTGRASLFKSELEFFINNPFFGIGVGSGKYARRELHNIEAASHNEISRLLGEHGVIGLLILLLLIYIPLKHLYYSPYLARAFLSAFFLFWFLTINHSAMRIAFPAFIYGLSVCTIYFDENEDSLHR